MSSAILHNKTSNKRIIIQHAKLSCPCRRISPIFVYGECMTEVCEAERNLRRNSSYCIWCCSTTLYGEGLQASGLQAFSRSKSFQVHRLLDPEPCLDDLLYLTALVAFVLSPTPRGNKDLILNDVVILSVLS